MTVFLESPWPALLLTVFSIVGLALATVQTGNLKLLWAIAGVALVGGGLLVLEWVVVTEREEVENALDGVAASLVANEPKVTLAKFTADSPRRSELAGILARVQFREARIGGDLEIQLHQETNPPSAITTFTGRATLHDTRGSIPFETLLRRFKVTLHRQHGEWLVYDYEDVEIRVGRP